MPDTFDALKQAGQIGPLTLKNRMIVSAMGTNLADPEGYVSQRIVDFHERHAQGGVRSLRSGMGPALPGSVVGGGRN